jgi:hypothetical protein
VGRWSQLSGAVVSGLEDMIAAVWGSCLGLLDMIQDHSSGEVVAAVWGSGVGVEDMTQYHSSGEVVAAVWGSGVGVGEHDSGPQQWGGGYLV